MRSYKNAFVSEKLLLAWIEPGERIVKWDKDGSFYSANVDHWVTDVHKNGEPVNFTFDPQEKKVTFEDPTYSSADFIFVNYRLFFSNIPVDLPFDLEEGSRIVPYEGRISDTSKFGAELDSERKGTALESNGSIQLFNNDGNFDPTFDRWAWEGAKSTLFALDKERLDEKVILFRGEVTSKDFTSQNITLGLSDFIYSLREPISLPKFELDIDNKELTGQEDAEESRIYQRRIYGRVNGLHLPALDKVEDHIDASGTFSVLIEPLELVVSTIQEGSPTQNEIQLIQTLHPTDGLDVVPTGGSFTLELQGAVSSLLNYNVTPSRLQQAFLALNRETLVTGSFTSGFVVEFVGVDAKTDVPQCSAYSMLSKQKLTTIVGKNSDIHNEMTPGDQIVGLINSQGEYKEFETTLRIDTLSRKRILEKIPGEIDIFDFGTYLQLEGVTTDLITQYLEVNDYILLKGNAVELANRGVWKVSSIPAPGTINLVNAAGTGGVTQTNCRMEQDSDLFAIVEDNTKQRITFAGELPSSFQDQKIFFSPQATTRYRNRRFRLCHHEVHQPTYEVLYRRPSDYKVLLESTEGLFAGDILIEQATNRQATIAEIQHDGYCRLVADDVSSIIRNSTHFTRPAVQFLYTSAKDNTTKKIQAQIIRHESYQTTSNELLIDNLGEFSSSPANSLVGTCIFTQGCKLVYAPGGHLDIAFLLADKAATRAWLRVPTGEWYEVEEYIDNYSLILRDAFAEASIEATKIEYKTPFYISDDTEVIADVYGKKSSDGKLIISPAQVIKDILDEGGDIVYNASSFEKAHRDFPYLVSLALPLSKTGAPPLRRDVISLMNDACFGCLFNNINMEASYKVLSASRKMEDVLYLDDTDIISFTVDAISDQIVSRVNCSYRHQDLDPYTLKEGFQRLSHENLSTIYQKMTKQELGTEKDPLKLYLYSELATKKMAQFYGFLNRCSKNIVKIELKLQALDKCLNDIVLVKFDRLYGRYGSSGKGNFRIGIINKIIKDGESITLEVDDLGNLFHSVGVVAGSEDGWNVTSDYQRLFGAWITDKDGLIGDQEFTKRINLIGR